MSTRSIALPDVDELAGISLLDTMRRRRSVRAYRSGGLSWREIGQLAWAAQGITDNVSALRTVPSAGALYPLELDIATQDGTFRYRPATHAVSQRTAADIRTRLAHAAYEQSWLASAACIFAIVALPNRTESKYGNRALRYVHLEAGHAAQNLLLMAAGLNLGGTPVGAFDDDAVARTLELGRNEAPACLVPIGWPSTTST